MNIINFTLQYPLLCQPHLITRANARELEYAFGCVAYGLELNMVKLHIKRGDESQFLFETTVEVALSELLVQLVRLQNGRLKVSRLCQGIWYMSYMPIDNDIYDVPHRTTWLGQTYGNLNHVVMVRINWNKCVKIRRNWTFGSARCDVAAQHARSDRGADWWAKTQRWLCRSLHS